MTGSEIKAMRERNGWTQSSLALAIYAKLGTFPQPATLSNWENDKQVPSGPYMVVLEQIEAETRGDVS